MSDGLNTHEELYRRFRESLSKPVLERFFDEDELVEVYDYAGDLNDDYVQMEALFCGARLYPESQALAERRCLLYLDTSIDDSDEPSPAAGAFLNDHPEVASPLLDIARLEVNPPENVTEALEYLLTQYDSFNDEEMIRFLNLAFDLDCYKWVVGNLDRIRTKIDNQPLIMYELVREADANMDNDTMAAAAEELIEAEPFSVPYWEMLFKAQARKGDEESARSTFDYATSLAADEPQSLLVLANDAYAYAPYLHKEAFDLLEETRKNDPSNFAYTDLQAGLLVAADAPGRAIAIIKDFLKENPGDHTAMRQLLRCNVPDAEEYLDRFMNATEHEGFSAEELSELMSVLSMGTSYRSLAALLTLLGPVESLDELSFCTFVEAHFALGHFDKVVEMVEAYPNTDAAFLVPLKGASLSFAYMTSLMKTGRGEKDALAHFEKVRPLYEQAMADAPMPIKMCIRLVFTLVDKIEKHPASDKFYWECFDMLWYSKF